MEIRPVELNDNEALAIAVRKVLIEMGVPKVGTAYEDIETTQMYEAYQTPKSFYLVIEDSGHIRGGVGIKPLKASKPGICELQKMYFLKELRGQGWGKKMLVACLEKAKKEGYEFCYLETIPALKAAIRLYEQHGFEYLNAPMGQTGHHSCDLWMLKKL